MHVALGHSPDEQHGIEIDDRGARSARLHIVAELDIRGFHHAVEWGADHRSFDIEPRRLEPRLGRGEQGAGLGGGGFGLEALRLQPQASLVIDAGLLERFASFRHPRRPVVVG